ncbi:hypothetical protein [Aeromicrobium yanjiei]|uniref:Uncharacterized protein n=1 Tax=Aeromicrobium yanjiei TaxID=2662028 RepID=A0A5Q2MJM5_9ACTN|nr:hypothetical protein [Aeromicrobium yanjiei]QGG40505.1 hypothetical protein GEV26_03490 [Aeromicrobium yanjiei]
MTLRPLSDLSPADWFVRAKADWWTKVCLGPPGHEAYARLQLVPADDESDVDLGLLTSTVLQRALPRHTATPDECLFGQWDGCGWEPPVPPARETVPLTGQVAPGVHDVVRTYHLFSGTVANLAAWDGGDPPHLMWPADRAWFVTKDVDPDWVGVGGTQSLIDELLAADGIDAAPSSYDASDWEAR